MKETRSQLTKELHRPRLRHRSRETRIAENGVEFRQSLVEPLPRAAMAHKDDEEVSLVEEGHDLHAQGGVGDESGAVPLPPPTLGREEKRKSPFCAAL